MFCLNTSDMAYLRPGSFVRTRKDPGGWLASILLALSRDSLPYLRWGWG